MGFILTLAGESRGHSSPEQERTYGSNYSGEKRKGSVGTAMLPEFDMQMLYGFSNGPEVCLMGELSWIILREIIPRNCWKNNIERQVSGPRGPGEIGVTVMIRCGHQSKQAWRQAKCNLATSHGEVSKHTQKRPMRKGPTSDLSHSWRTSTPNKKWIQGKISFLFLTSFLPWRPFKNSWPRMKKNREVTNPSSHWKT